MENIMEESGRKNNQFFLSPLLSNLGLPNELALGSVCSQLGSCGTLQWFKSSPLEIFQGGEEP